jgi:glutamate synthase (NADPH/NADH) small chain
MGKSGAYLNVGRVEHDVRPAAEAVRDYEDLVRPLPLEKQREQASRCMACGVAFCQVGGVFPGQRRAVGCPLHNLIPETNDLLYRGFMDDAAARLALTNPFPEFTGRVCPAPCEVACNLGLHEEATTIHDDERAISDWAWAQDEDARPRSVRPLPAAADDAPLVSVVGSGPAGLACAWELARRGLRVHVVERADRPGGLLEYGIPNMKLPKDVVDRRINLMKASGITFTCDYDAGAHAGELLEASDAVVVAAGATAARHVNVPGADLDGIVFAVDYLAGSTRALLDGREPAITAEGKDVVVLGGGDTGTDCVATALRQNAASVRQVIRAAKAPAKPTDADTLAQLKLASWPNGASVFTESYGQTEARVVEGADPRLFSTDTIAFEGDEDGAVTAVRTQQLSYEGGRHRVEGTESSVPAQLVLIAKGFVGPEKPLLDAFGITVVSDAGSVRPATVPDSHEAARSHEVSDACPVFVAGDARIGASIVASAIHDGLVCAGEVAAKLGR